MKKLLLLALSFFVILTSCSNDKKISELHEIKSKIKLTLADETYDGEVYYAGKILKLKLNLSEITIEFYYDSKKMTVTFADLEYEAKGENKIKLVSVLKSIFDTAPSYAEDAGNGLYEARGKADDLLYKAVLQKSGEYKSIEFPAIKLKIEFE